MTNKEAIEVLKVAKAEVEWEYPLDYQIAFDKAIKALEQEPCEDAINREQAKSAIRDRFKDLPSRVEINTILNDLPSVTPKFTDAEIQKMQELEQAEIQKAYELGKVEQPKTGHWNAYEVFQGRIKEEWLECSECKWSNALLIPRNYCPNCGLRMTESEE